MKKTQLAVWGAKGAVRRGGPSGHHEVIDMEDGIVSAEVRK